MRFARERRVPFVVLDRPQSLPVDQVGVETEVSSAALVDHLLHRGAAFEVEGCIYLGEKWEYRLKRGDLRLRAQGHEPLTAATAHCRIPAAATWLFNP